MFGRSRTPGWPSSPDGGRQADEGDSGKNIGAPHRAYGVGDKHGQSAIEADVLVHGEMRAGLFMLGETRIGMCLMVIILF